MDAENTRNALGDKESSQSRLGKRNYQQHTVEQIQPLKSYFKECANPDENRTEELSRELGLDPQNKMTQNKTHNEKEDNYTLRADKDELLRENLTLREAMKNRDERIKALMIENTELKEKIQNTADLVSVKPENAPSLQPKIKPNHLPDEEAAMSSPQPKSRERKEVTRRVIRELDNNALLKIAASAMKELLVLLHTREPVWVNSADGRCTLHRDTYERLFPTPSLSPLKSTNARIESSMDSAQVAIPGANLFQVFLDTDIWKDIFPTIVMKAKTIKVLDAQNLGGSIHLMYEKVHVLSPLVASREFVLLRYCRQLSSNSWAVADVSFDLFKNVPKANPVRSWKFPSGCMIEDAPHGKSNVKWVEHVQVEDKLPNHRLYRDLVWSSQAYGAKRWISALRMICERSAFSMAPILAPKHVPEGVIDTVKGRNNLMRLSQRMVRNFNEALDMSEEFDLSHMPELKSNGLQVTMRKNTVPGQPDGLILGATTSLWLPLSTEVIFNFFNDENLRALWDVLANGNPVNTIARISSGSHAGNSISVIKPLVPRENNMFILQETIVDSLGAMLVYAPIEIPDISSVIKGEDAQKVQILPSGYVISSDCNKNEADGASSSRPSRNPEGSLLTVFLQILASRGKKPNQVRMETVSMFRSLIRSTMKNIREGLDCAEAD